MEVSGDSTTMPAKAKILKIPTVRRTDSLYAKLGGKTAIKAVVEEFYERVLADPELAPFFAKTNMTWLKTRQTQFFSQALGGPEIYRGQPMGPAHENLQIEDRHFAHVAKHLVGSLQSLRVPKNLIDEVVALVAPLKAEIVNTFPNSTARPPKGEKAMAATSLVEQQSVASQTRAMVENVPINLIVADRDLRIQYINPASAKTLKSIEHLLPCKADQVVGQVIDIFHKNPEHQRKLLANDKNLPHRAVIQLGPENLELLVSALYDDNKNYVGAMVTWEVVTEKLRLKQDMAGQVSAISKSQAVVEFKMDGTITEANENFLKLMGYTLDEVKGKHHSIFVDEAFRRSPEYKEFWAKLNRGEYEANQYKRIGKGGKEVWIQASYNPIMDLNGKPFKVVKYATDITEQKLSNADFAGQIAAISKSQLVLEFTMDGTIVTANDNLLNIFGYSLDAIKGKHHSIFVDEAHRNSPEYRAFWAKLNQGEAQTSEYKRVGKGGDPVWIQATYNPILDLNGRPFKVVEYASDVTPQKQAAEELKQKVDSISRVVAAAAAGDLTHEVSVSGQDVIGQMGEGLARFFKDLRGSISAISQNSQSLANASEELSSTSQQMSANAEETSTQANVVSASAEQVDKNLQTVATGTEEMSASIKEIAKNAHESAKVATAAVKVADDTNQIVSKLGDSSIEIGQVIKVITSIAQQTNLLALNATIEAARAGEAGKGFAVVANEVKELAKQTAKATEDISRKIEAIQGDTKGAVGAIGQISSIIKQVNDISNTIATAVEEQNATTNEMARNVGEAAKGSGEISKNIGGVAEAAKSTSHGANDSLKASQALAKTATELRELVQRFKI